MNPFARVPLGSTSLQVTQLGLGTAALAHDSTSEAEALDCVTKAWEAGIRYFDTAPMYGFGEAELRSGKILAELPRDEFVLSTKVGRLVPGYEPGGDAGTAWEFDFTADAIKRSVEHSLARLGVDRIDILLIHDPDAHWETAINEAYPVLDEYRRQGVVSAIGIGMTQVPMPIRFVQETNIDALLLAGRYSLLDTEGAEELLPLCLKRGVSVFNAQSLHGGLIDGVRNAQFHYKPVDEATKAKAETIRSICHSHGIPTAAAALQFPLAHPAVTAVLTGPSSGAQLAGNLEWAQTPVPGGVWTDLKAAGILPPDIPTPGEETGR